jgi:hypothetical protein
VAPGISLKALIWFSAFRVKIDTTKATGKAGAVLSIGQLKVGKDAKIGVPLPQ